MSDDTTRALDHEALQAIGADDANLQREAAMASERLMAAAGLHPMTGRDRAINASRLGLEVIRLGAILNAFPFLMWAAPKGADVAWFAGIMAAVTALAAGYFHDNALAWFPSGHPIARRLYPIAVLSTVMVYIFWLIGITIWRF